MIEPRRPRKDAVANHERLLATAFDLLGSRNADVSVNELAAAAGVGAGTAYRHFPDHDALVRALYDRAAEEFTAGLRMPPETESAWERFAGLVESVVLLLADLPGLRAVMRLMYEVEPEYAPTQVMAAPFADLVAAAKAEGEMREDLKLGDITLTMFALGSFVGHPQGVERDALRRAILIALDGMRATSTRHELPEAPMTMDEFHAFTHRRNAPPQD
ncbi:TetR/AcrR family transcriptional regulator [Demequina salsinemoris]|uniref:TetR/AcrR family transcriptional regulator n=1 Tax=Demequina salsinemoris TaxID=577470 RepID=UPI0007819988|nr:TetR family transcriptional regulator [Demequina salsinemoris]